MGGSLSVPHNHIHNWYLFRGVRCHAAVHALEELDKNYGAMFPDAERAYRKMRSDGKQVLALAQNDPLRPSKEELLQASSKAYRDRIDTLVTCVDGAQAYWAHAQGILACLQDQQPAWWENYEKTLAHTLRVAEEYLCDPNSFGHTASLDREMEFHRKMIHRIVDEFQLTLPMPTTIMSF